ncbi:ABC transporter permease subunit [Planctomycetales bacterium ZRK34]|nr:ABC transporter permease subunit [Planctomycetales bacterium ZRK34]
MKYKILKALDVAGLKVFEPIVRLCYGEEPRVQVVKIGKFIVVPVIVFCIFLGLWGMIAPRHKTKYGEVPTPAVVWDAFNGVYDFHVRENTKQDDYRRSGQDRSQTIEQVNAELAAIEPDAAAAHKHLDEVKAEVDASLKAELKPLQDEYNVMKTAAFDARKQREAELKEAADCIKADDTDARESLLASIIDHENKTDADRDKLDELKAKTNTLLAAKAPRLLAAQQQVNAIEEQRMYLNMRLQRLESDNREVRLADAETDLKAIHAEYLTASGPKLLALGKNIVRSEQRLEKTKTAEPAGPWTFFEQIARSLACVFLGFAIAAGIAIPVGILCGLSPVVMASMTPLISLFKPVSPIVWLPIVLIIVGGFYANPDQAWIQPSFLASAITVALCSLWPTLTNTAFGVAAIDKDHLNVARVLRLGFFTRLFKIIIPSALPLIFAGLRISLGVGWMVLIAAELLSSSEGIGKFVWDMFNNGSSQTFAQMFVVVFFVGAIGMFLDRIMIVLQRLVSFDEAPTAI